MQQSESAIKIQQVLKELYSNHNSPLKIKQAEAWLVDFQRSPQAYLTALELLNSYEPNLLFFAAQTFYKCLHRDWTDMDLSARQRIGSALVNFLYTTAIQKPIPAFVLSKIVLALAVFSIKFTDLETDTIPKFCSNTMLVSGDHRALLCKIVIQYLGFIPEEADKMQFVYSDGINVKFRIATMSSFALENVMPLLKDPNTEIQTAALQCVSSWSQNSTIDTTDFFRLFEDIVFLLGNEDLLETTVDVLMALLADSRISGKEKSVALHLYPILVEMNSKLMGSIREEDEDFVLPFCKLLCKFSETFVGFLIESLPSTRPFFDMLLACTAYPAIYPSNPDISEILHYFWFTLEGEIESGNELQAVKYSAEIIQQAHEIMLQVLSVFVQQTTYPSDEIVSSWTKDFRDRFRTHRHECADTSLYCYYALNERALFQVVTGISNEVQMLLSDSSRGCQLLETYLYHFRAFSESVSSDESQFVPAIFQESTFQAFIQISHAQRNGSEIFRSTLAATIGNYAEWLSFHTAALPICVNFLVGELQTTNNPRIAASALVEVCSICHDALSKHCDEVLQLCVTALNNCPSEIKSQIFQSISYIVKSLPANEASPRLVFLLNGIIDELSNELGKCEQVQTMDDILRDSVVMHLDFIRSFSKGGGDSYSEINIIHDQEAPVLEAEFQVGERVLGIVSRIFSNFSHETILLQEVSLVVKDCSKSGLGFFKPHLISFYQVVASGFTKTSHAFLLTALVSVYRAINLTTSSTAPFPLQSVLKPTFEVSTVFASNFSTTEGMESHPDVACEFFDFLGEILTSNRGLLEQLPHELLHAIFIVALVNALQVQEMLAFQSVLKFLHFFLDFVQASSSVPAVLQEIAQAIYKPVIKQFIRGIGGGQGQSVLPKICKSLLEMIVAFPTLAQQALAECLQQDGFPSSSVSMLEKEAFMKSVLANRKLKALQDVVKAFSISCRRNSDELDSMS